jgi:protein-tyrosine-phosphatase
VCVGNACRSPMAEAIARNDAADVMEASSAGLSPLGFIPELTKQTLKHNDYPALKLTSDALTPEACDAADVIINMSGRSREAHFRDPQKVEDWNVPDPYEDDPQTYQRVFESIKRRVNQLAVGLREKRDGRQR